MSDDYLEKGFRVRRGLIPSDLIGALNARFDELVEKRVEPAPNCQIVRNIEVAKGLVQPQTPAHGVSKINFIMSDEVLSRYAKYEPLLDEVAAMIGRDLLAMNTMYLNKPPEVDGRHPLHQDLLYFPFRPADKIVGAWTALQKVTREHGCLVVLPGSHKGPLLEHDYPDWEHKNFLFLGVKDLDASGRVHIEMEPGDTIFFHPLLIHGSGLNRTGELRRAIAAHFVSSHCEDIWDGKTDYVKGYDPRADYRLLRGADPHGYAVSE